MQRDEEEERDFGSDYRIIMLAVLKEGPLTLKELEEKTSMLKARLPFRERIEKRRLKRREKPDVAAACVSLVDQKLLCLIEDEKYTLTETGKAKAERTAKAMERGVDVLEKQLLSPSATARNTIFVYTFLAVVKLLAGFLTGSVGLIADGADTSVDTVSAGVVWVGIRCKKELLGTATILVLMFVTAVTLAYESAISIIGNAQGTFLPMSMPYVVIIVEGAALILAFTFSLYQRFVGRRSKSLALISQSIDAQNSVYSTAAVIVGAVFSLFRVYWVDAVVGGFIAVKITWAAVGLSRQALNSMRGKEPEFTKYKLPFEKQIEIRRMETFRNWILYAIQEEKISKKHEIISSLERTFKPKYMPALFSELTVGKLFDFESNFAEVVQPLVDKEYLGEADGTFTLTDKGRAYVKNMLSNMRYRESEL